MLVADREQPLEPSQSFFRDFSVVAIFPMGPIDGSAAQPVRWCAVANFLAVVQEWNAVEREVQSGGRVCSVIAELDHCAAPVMIVIEAKQPRAFGILLPVRFPLFSYVDRRRSIANDRTKCQEPLEVVTDIEGVQLVVGPVGFRE